MNQFLTLVLISTIAGMATVFGGLLVLIKRPGRKMLGLFGGFAGGVMITVSFVDLLAESINISNYSADATITFTHTLDEVITVEVYNESLYGSYGGWLMMPENKYTVNTTFFILLLSYNGHFTSAYFRSA